MNLDSASESFLFLGFPVNCSPCRSPFIAKLPSHGAYKIGSLFHGGRFIAPTYVFLIGFSERPFGWSVIILTSRLPALSQRQVITTLLWFCFHCFSSFFFRTDVNSLFSNDLLLLSPQANGQSPLLHLRPQMANFLTSVSLYFSGWKALNTPPRSCFQRPTSFLF